MDSKALQSRLIEAIEALGTQRLWTYKPHPKQLLHHDRGAKYRQRLLMAGNQQGKSEAGAAETAMHATGMYPDWWQGYRFESLPLIWCGGVTTVTVRDVIQEKLFGPHGSLGTGWIPKHLIVSTTPSRGVPGAIDFAIIRRLNGTTTKIQFKAYEQGWQKWQAAPVPFIWLDEEPEPEIWSEAVARTTAVDGLIQMTFTPLQGMSQVVRQFYPKPNTKTKIVTRMGLKDALHIPESRYADILAQYPPHERDARIEGIPMLGSGAVYPIDRALIACDPFPVPSYWPKVIGIDFGRGDHPTCGALLAHDRDNDVVYVVDTHRDVDPRMAVNAAAMMRWGDVPVSWPHDGHSREPGEGRKLADMYRSHGLKMLPIHAQHSEATPMTGSRVNMTSVDAGIQEILTRMHEGRFKVFTILNDWWEEFAMYHRKDGKIVKEFDDLMDATRYAIMGLRYARVRRTRAQSFPAQLPEYDPFAPRRPARYDPAQEHGESFAAVSRYGVN